MAARVGRGDLLGLLPRVMAVVRNVLAILKRARFFVFAFRVADGDPFLRMHLVVKSRGKRKVLAFKLGAQGIADNLVHIRFSVLELNCGNSLRSYAFLLVQHGLQVQLARGGIFRGRSGYERDVIEIAGAVVRFGGERRGSLRGAQFRDRNHENENAEDKFTHDPTSLFVSYCGCLTATTKHHCFSKIANSSTVSPRSFLPCSLTVLVLPSLEISHVSVNTFWPSR